MTRCLVSYRYTVILSVQYIEGTVTAPSRWFKTLKYLIKRVPPIFKTKSGHASTATPWENLDFEDTRGLIHILWEQCKDDDTSWPMQQCTRLRTALTEVNWCVSFSSAVALLKLLRAKQIPSPRDWKKNGKSASAGLSTWGLRGFDGMPFTRCNGMVIWQRTFLKKRPSVHNVQDGIDPA